MKILAHIQSAVSFVIINQHVLPINMNSSHWYLKKSSMSLYFFHYLTWDYAILNAPSFHEEVDILRSQNVISNIKGRGGRRYAPLHMN